MDAKKIIKAAGIAHASLGIIHLIAQFLGPGGDEVPQVVQLMRDYKIELMGTHTLMSFHIGFSIMTGLFMVTIGFIQVIHASDINSSMLRTFMFFTLIAFVVSLIYFHPLAYGFIFIGFIFQLIAFRKLT